MNYDCVCRTAPATPVLLKSKNKHHPEVARERDKDKAKNINSVHFLQLEMSHFKKSKETCFIDRPGVAGAVLQTAS